MVSKRYSIHFANWSKTTKYQTFCNLPSCRTPKFSFWGIFHYIKHFSTVRWPFQKYLLSVLERCPSYREYSYSKMTEKRQEQTPCVRLMEVSVMRELTIIPRLIRRSWVRFPQKFNQFFSQLAWYLIPFNLHHIFVCYFHRLVKTVPNFLRLEEKCLFISAPSVNIL